MIEIIEVILATAAIFSAIMLNLAVRPHVSRKLIGFAVGITVVGGLLIYGYGYACTSDSVLLAVIRATFAVCKIFVGENDLDDISGAPLFQYTLTHIFFWLLHLMGLFGSTSAAITALGSRLLRQLRTWLIRKRDLAVIYSLTPNTLEFGRKLLNESDISLVYVDPDGDSSLSSAVDHMGCLLRSDEEALSATPRFLRSLGLRPGSRKIWLYALSADMAADRQYAQSFLDSLKQQNIHTEQTALTIQGPEDETDNQFQARSERYGYGSVISMNETEMAARLLIRSYPPCDTLSFDSQGRALQDFHVLLIGFGKAGQAVLRQLVMNGQFEGSTFRASIFAPDYDQVMGRLCSECEELLTQYDIQFFAHDGRSRELYRYLNQNAGNLRYIAVCTGSDLRNAEIADELQPYLSRRGCRIPVYQCSRTGIRCKSSAGSIVQHSLYTPEILCSDQIDRMAMALNQSYCGSGTARENWKKCDYFSRMSSRASADFTAAMLRIAGVSPEEALVSWDPQGELMENLAKTEHLRWCAFHYCMGFRPMTREEFDARTAVFRRELAEQGASRIRIGKDLIQGTHACLIPWEDLDELSARENAITGKRIDYKEMDRSNVRAIPDVLRAMAGEI